MKKLKRGDMVVFIQSYKDTVQKGETCLIDKAIYIDDVLQSVYIKAETNYIYFGLEDFELYCKPYEIKKFVSVSMPSDKEVKKMREVECKIIDEILKKAEKQMEEAVREYDYINPSHYKLGTMETFDMMVLIWGKEKAIAHCEMTAFKYRMRAGKKPDQPIERDMEKAKWYDNKAKELRNEQK